MRVVIVGTGPAGITAAETLRRHDRDSAVTMLSAEPYPPYSPPALADHFLTGRDSTLFWKGRDICERLGIEERRDARVASVREDRREVVLESGETLGYDALVLASGSRLYAPVEGNALPGVHDFKSLRTATALAERVREGKARSALIVGAGFIGVEIALLLADLGVSVAIVEMCDRVMPRMLDLETAGFVRGALEGRGVEVRLDTQVRSFEGRRKATGVRIATGEVLKADLHIAATGVKPNVEFLAGSGIEVGWGVRVDRHLRTGVPGIYAAGDAAEAPDWRTGEPRVLAIFHNAVSQGQVVGYNLLGRDVAYDGAEAMNSLKHLGLPVVAAGSMDATEEIRWRRGGTLRKVFLDDGRIVGFQLVGDVTGAGLYRSLMLRRADVRRFGGVLIEPTFSMAFPVWTAA